MEFSHLNSNISTFTPTVTKMVQSLPPKTSGDSKSPKPGRFMQMPVLNENLM
jgi:hypothetical protein